MDTPGAKELLGMIKRLETLAKERIALAEAGTTVPVLDDAATEMIRSVKEALADNRLAGLPTPSWSLPEETVAPTPRIQLPEEK